MGCIVRGGCPASVRPSASVRSPFPKFAFPPERSPLRLTGGGHSQRRRPGGLRATAAGKARPAFTLDVFFWKNIFTYLPLEGIVGYFPLMFTTKHANNLNFFPGISDFDIGLVFDVDLVGSLPLRTSSASVAGEGAAAESALARSAAK